jgi:adenylate kinase
MTTFIVLLGPPGAGKGTQAKLLSEHLHLAHISSGDLFRENLKGQTELGKLAQTYMGKGELVPDDVTIAMIRERLTRPDCVAGAILDGFPRTTAQADALDKMLKEFGGKVDKVPYVTAPEKVLVERLSGRWTCRANGHVYHDKNNPPKQAKICDIDGSELYQRDDDQPETVVRRIQVYLEQTAPLIAYFRQRGNLIEIDGTQNIQKVTKAFLSALKK